MKIKLINLTKKFVSMRGEITAVSNVNIEIGDKEFFVLLGPSGCGKSTILNLVAGLETPTGGEIWFDEKIITKNEKVYLTPKQRNIGMVFQSYALYPHMSVFENISFPLKIRRYKRDEINKLVNEVASILKISHLLRAKPSELSGGERQRVAIARAIVRKPDLLLFDEPLSNLDAKLRISTRTELKNLQKEIGITTIYVTHDQIEAMALGHRIAVLKEGKIQQIGTPHELYENPFNTFVASFIGSPPMNLITLPFIVENGVYYILIGENKVKIPDSKVPSRAESKRSFIFGIRPEDIIIGSQPDSIKAKVCSVEPLGRQILLVIDIDKYKFSVLTNYSHYKIDEFIKIKFNLDKMYIFSLDNT